MAGGLLALFLSLLAFLDVHANPATFNYLSHFEGFAVLLLMLKEGKKEDTKNAKIHKRNRFFEEDNFTSPFP